MADKNVHLSEVQFAVMQALWSEGRATTATVYERVGKGRSLAYTTVATLLTRLERRGLVRSNKDTRERTFEPLVSESDVKRFMVSELVGKLFRGDPGALVSHLLKESEIDEGDRETVRRMLAEASKETKHAK
jgi:BlaI family penicillinase repressor